MSSSLPSSVFSSQLAGTISLASRKSSVAAAPYTGIGFFFRKVESPLTWSLCSWVTRMPAQSLTASPSDLSAAVVVRTPLPISTMRYCAPQRTTLLLPEEPEYNEMNSAMKTSYVTT